jgi:hypothetical protein
MRTLVRLFVGASFAIAFLAFTAVAKRVPPKPVPPVVLNGIRFSAGGDGRNQYVVAEDPSNGKELWRVKVFHNRIKFWIEEDVQWVFITNLKAMENSLLVRDELSRCYSINLASKHIKKLQCGGFFSQ